jgi:hypothetical protein
MSMDSDDKVQSKFPRSSLRARNKTLMITPADVADYQVNTDKQPANAAELGDVFEDTFSALGDSSGEINGLVAEPELGEGQEVVSSDDESSGIGLDALSDEWEVEEEDGIGGGLPVAEGLSDGESDDDIFAAPPGPSTKGDELFEPVPAAEPAPRLDDPIVRGNRSTMAGFDSLKTQPASVDGQAVLHSYNYQFGAGGSVLQSAAQELKDAHRGKPSTEAREYVDWKKPAKLVGFLVSYVSDSMGSYIELREGRLLVTSGGSSTDSCLVIADDSVSPMHAIMRISVDGSILILDQLSEHGTRIRRAESGKEESLMGDKSSLCHGDVVIFGECEYHVVVMGAAALKRGN